jgi:hypothetical protein
LNKPVVRDFQVELAAVCRGLVVKIHSQTYCVV